MSRAQTILGPILNPRADGTVSFHPRGALSCDDDGTIDYAGSAGQLPPRKSGAAMRRRSDRNRPAESIDDEVVLKLHLVAPIKK